MNPHIKCNHFSARNNKLVDKPNEDYILTDPDAGIFIILDGVSRDGDPYPVSSPSAMASEVCARAIFQAVKLAPHGTEPGEILFRAVVEGNAAVSALNRDYVGDFAPGTCGIAAVIRQDRLYFAQIGDCSGWVLGSEGGAFCFTFDFIQPLRQYQRNRKYYGLDKHAVRKDLCNNPRSLLGYGVLNGNPAAAAFVKTHSIPLERGARIIFHTDGLDGWMHHMISDGNFARLREISPEEMVTASAAFDRDAGKTSDDTSAIVIDL